LSSIDSIFEPIGYLYKQHFNPYNPSEGLLFSNTYGCHFSQFKITTDLQSNMTYILIVTTSIERYIGNFSILVTGPNNVIFNSTSKFNILIATLSSVSNSLDLQTTYMSELAEQNQVYPRVCGIGNYHYEIVHINVE